MKKDRNTKRRRGLLDIASDFGKTNAEKRQRGIFDQPIFKQEKAKIRTREPFLKQFTNIEPIGVKPSEYARSRNIQRKPGKSKHPLSIFLDAPRKPNKKKTSHKTKRTRPIIITRHMTVRGRQVSEAERKAIWAKKDQGAALPEGWKEGARQRRILEEMGVIKKDTEADIQKSAEEISDQFFIPLVNSFKGSRTASVDASKGVQGPAVNLYDRCKQRAIKRLKQKRKAIPPENSYQMRKYILAEHSAIMEASEHPMGIAQSKRDEARKKFMDMCKRDEEYIKEKIRTGPYDAETALKESKRANKEELEKIEKYLSISSFPFKNIIRSPSKKELQTQKQLIREKKRERHLAEREERRRKIEERRKKVKKTGAQPHIFPDERRDAESPAAKARRLAKEAEAKKASKKWKKEHRSFVEDGEDFFKMLVRQYR